MPTNSPCKWLREALEVTPSTASTLAFPARISGAIQQSHSSCSGLKIESVLSPSCLGLDLIVDHMATFPAFVGSEFAKRSQFRCLLFEQHDSPAPLAVFFVVFLIEHRVSLSSRNGRKRHSKDGSVAFLDVSTKLIFGIFLLVPDASL